LRTKASTCSGTCPRTRAGTSPSPNTRAGTGPSTETGSSARSSPTPGNL